MALADDESPAFVARAMNAIGSMFIDMPKVAEAFRGNGALSLGRPPPVPVLGHRVVLPHRLPGRAARTGSPPSTASPRSCTPGPASPTSAAATARRSSCSPRRSPRRTSPGSTSTPRRSTPPRSGRRRPASSAQTTFEVADAKGYDGTFDLICFFDCLHDMGDPVGIARHALEHLAEDGTVLLVEPFALDGRADEHRRATRWPRCSTRRRRRSARRTRCRRRSGSASAPRPARPASARSSSRPASRTFRRAAETPLNLILEAKR